MQGRSLLLRPYSCKIGRSVGTRVGQVVQHDWIGPDVVPLWVVGKMLFVCVRGGRGEYQEKEETGTGGQHVCSQRVWIVGLQLAVSSSVKSQVSSVIVSGESGEDQAN